MSDPERPTEVDDVRRRRGEIGRVVAELEQALAAPTGLGDAWRPRVVEALRELDRLGREQRETVAGPDGLIHDLRRQRPMMVKRAEALQVGLDEALDQLDELVEWVSGAQPVEIRDRLLPLFGQVARLRQSMADLMWDAYWVDLGGQR